MLYENIEAFRLVQERSVRQDRRLSQKGKNDRIERILANVTRIRTCVQEIQEMVSIVPSDLVINISGTLYKTTLAAMSSEPNSRLESMFATTTFETDHTFEDRTIYRDVDGNPYFDDPVFIYICTFLTTGYVDISDLSLPHLHQLVAMVDLYEIAGMKELCRHRLRKHTGDLSSTRWLEQLSLILPAVAFTYIEGRFMVASDGVFIQRGYVPTKIQDLNEASSYLASIGIRSHQRRSPFIQQQRSREYLFMSIMDDDVWDFLHKM
jgi:hypothetical protein